MNPTILVVEDEHAMRILLREFLEILGYNVIGAEQGKEAIEISRSNPVDLAFLDMNLPDMNGLTLIQHLRGDPQTRPLRCIALSADAMREQIDAALAAGFDDYWTKPIDVRQVLHDLGRLLAEPAPG